MRKSRVMVVAVGLFFALLILWVRAGWLQIVRHEHYKARATSIQEGRVLVKPVRGELRDRRGRPLARDLLSYSVSADPAIMTDPRATARKVARVLDLDARDLEHRFRPRPRFAFVDRQVQPRLGQKVQALGLPGIYVSFDTRREYLLGDAASEIVGRTNVDNAGIEGLELQLDDVLRGSAGWRTVVKTGDGKSHELPGGAHREAQDGQNVVLTIDADLQAIVEEHLADKVRELRAKRGFALFLDPRTGEILAAANAPHLPAGKARNWNFTDLIEPGSTFKIVVAAAAIEERLVSPDQWFEASEDGRPVEVAQDARFTDVHREAGYTFRDAVRWSSNIVMGKVGVIVGAERLYHYCTELGFGSVTGLAFPGEASGMLRTPDRWSARSAPTIAIGYEVSVTPLQLALAYAAVANGGMLMHPMLVREVIGPDGQTKRNTPHAVRRVFRESTAHLLRDFLTAVVDSGTAHAAQVPGLAVAGKTGTARKYDAETGHYSRHRHVASFAGFARADQPTLVGVVVIDEPSNGHYYGGDVAAPLFGEIVSDARRLPRGPLQHGPYDVAARPEPPAPVAVPNLRLLLGKTAVAELHQLGLHPDVRGDGERVIGQQPAAGEAVERGANVTVWLSAPDDPAARVLPDVTGLSLREALRWLSRLEVTPHIEGSGVVVEQWPPPGTSLPIKTACRLRCRPDRFAAADLDGGRADAEEPAFVPAGARAPVRGGKP